MKKSKKMLILDIVFYTIIALSYILGIISIIARANGGVLYLFNNRFDIVLTESMAYKNSEHLDFLEGTVQIQKDDIVVSSKVDANSEIYIKDVILFNNSDLRGLLTAHRVVDIIEKGTLFTISDASKIEIDSKACFKLNNLQSSITLATSPVSLVEFHYYTNTEYQQLFYGQFGEITYIPKHETEKVGDLYLHKCSITRSNPFKVDSYIGISNYQDAYISSISFTLSDGKIYAFTGEEFNVSGGTFQKRFDLEIFYETRGDSVKSSESQLLPKDKVISRVHTVIPKFGGFVRFITSLYGIILIIGIGVVLTINSIIIDKYWRKKPENAGTIKEEVVEPKDADKKEGEEKDENN